MRRTAIAGVALLAAATLLTGCSSEGGEGKKDGAEAAASQTPAPRGSAPSGGQKAPAGGATHEVTLEVSGQGKTSIMYHADSSGFEEQALPFKKTETVTLTAAEQKVGYLITLVPGSVKGADGMLQQAPCVIKVDGKQVADNAEGKNSKGCTFTIKG
jgi:predicted small secreted protein